MQPRLLALTAGLLLPAVAHAYAQGTSPAAAPAASTQPAPQTGSFDFGGRIFHVDGDEARVQRYRDLRSGPFLENVRYMRDTDTWLFQAKADHVGYRDQRYDARVNRFGKVKASFQWDQIPLFYSVDTQTPYTEASPGVLRLDDAAQQAGLLSTVAALARPFDLRARRDTARFGLTVTPTRTLDLSVNMSSYHRDGQMPWSGSFGQSSTVTLPAPLDQRTTDLNAAAEWGSGRGSLRLQYDGSWFNNNVQTLVWDNPLRATDSPTLGSSQGRTALWPSSTMNAVSVTGTASLPARSRVTAYASVGRWNQNEDLLPFTINAAIAPIPLDRTTADAAADVTALTFSYTSRPVDRVWLSVRYRRYDFDNKTPEFHVTSSVAYDQTLQTSLLGGTEPFGYVRNWFDADASYNLTSFAALRVGYGLEDVARTFRLAETTVEHTIRASIDSTGNNYLTVRGVYEHSKRTGKGLDEEVLDEIGEQVSLRQFDISDRNRDRVSTIVQLTPIDALGINATIGVGRDERPDAYFGLQHANTRFFSVGADVVPNDSRRPDARLVDRRARWGALHLCERGREGEPEDGRAVRLRLQPVAQPLPVPGASQQYAGGAAATPARPERAPPRDLRRQVHLRAAPWGRPRLLVRQVHRGRLRAGHRDADAHRHAGCAPAWVRVASLYRQHGLGTAVVLLVVTGGAREDFAPSGNFFAAFTETVPVLPGAMALHWAVGRDRDWHGVCAMSRYDVICPAAHVDQRGSALRAGGSGAGERRGRRSEHTPGGAAARA